MLLGQYSGTIGSKRRVAIPKKFVKRLGNRMVIAKWYEKCLVLVSVEYWSALLNRLTGGPKMVTQSIRDVDRFILGSAYEVETDAQGRMVIPDLLYDFAELREEVIFLGLGDRVEVWSLEGWREKEKAVVDQARDALERIAREKNA